MQSSHYAQTLTFCQCLLSVILMYVMPNSVQHKDKTYLSFSLSFTSNYDCLWLASKYLVSLKDNIYTGSC